MAYNNVRSIIPRNNLVRGIWEGKFWGTTGLHKDFGTINASYDFQVSSWTPKITHVKFQALDHIFDQSIEQLT